MAISGTTARSSNRMRNPSYRRFKRRYQQVGEHQVQNQAVRGLTPYIGAKL
jgi:hypothetical protein